MFERYPSRRHMRAQLIGEVMRRLGALSQNLDPKASWERRIQVTQAHYALDVTLTHKGGDTTQMYAVNGQRYGNDHMIREFVAALGNRKGKYAHLSKEELVSIFRDNDYRLFD